MKNKCATLQQGYWTVSQSIHDLFCFCFTEYVDELLDLIFENVFQDPAPYLDEVLKIPIPEDLCAQFERPEKQELMCRGSIKDRSELAHKSPTPAYKAPVTAEQSGRDI